VAGGEAHPVRRSFTEHRHDVAQAIRLGSVAATRGEDRGMQFEDGSRSGFKPAFWRNDVADAEAGRTKQCVRGPMHHDTTVQNQATMKIRCARTTTLAQ
jgi:hypothetical protein